MPATKFSMVFTLQKQSQNQSLTLQEADDFSTAKPCSKNNHSYLIS
jgi:hypothetical protein